MDLQQREYLKTHLEKLSLVRESQNSGKNRNSLLQNWMATDYMDDDEDDIEKEESFLSEGFEYDASTGDVLRWPDSSYRTMPLETHSEYLGHRQEEMGRYNTSQKVSRLAKGLLKQDAQALSPLVLHHHDMPRFSQGQSYFTLEEPYDEEEQYLEDEFQSGMVDVPRQRPSRSRSHSPLMPTEARSLNRRQPSKLNGRYLPVLPSPAENVLTRTPSLKPVPFEADFLEYEVNALEVPKKHQDERIYSHKPKNPKQQANSQPFSWQDRASALDGTKTLRRKGNVADRVSRLQHGVSSSMHQSQSFEAEPLPLLTELEGPNGSKEDYVGSPIDGGFSSDQFHGELCLESHNALGGGYAGRKVQTAEKDKLQLAVQECKELALCDYRPRNLSQKYRPRLFEEVVGQSIVTQALSNAILKGKIAPVYLFQGSRGTGKTSAARIFASALICVSPENRRPCGTCQECASVATGKCTEVKEVDAASNNGIERVKALLNETISAPPLSRYKVFIIDECHVLTSETWNALLKILEEPPANVVFILITTDPDQLPRTAVSRCQKFPFIKIKDSEIVKRLEKLANMENLSMDVETLQLIASRSDGSLRDAETTLDQLSLLGQEIDSSSVYELVGSASDERMLSLLDSALLADTINTVRRVRELVDSGVEPLSLMSRLATLITDILAGSYNFTDEQRKGFFRRKTFSKEKLERLRMAMKTLSEAEKQLRVSNDRTTWLTAALLQLGPDNSFMFPPSCTGTSVTQSPVALDVGEGVDFEHTSSGRQTWDHEAIYSQNTGSSYFPSKSEIAGANGRVGSNQWSMNNKTVEIPSTSLNENATLTRLFTQGEATQGHTQFAQKSKHCEDPSGTEKHFNVENALSPTKLYDIWCRVMAACQSLPLGQLLYAHCKLVSILMSEVEAIVHLEVCHPEHKSRLARSQKSIANVFESVLGFPVEVRVSLTSLPAGEAAGDRTWVPSEEFQSSEGPLKTGPQSRKVYSLNSWKHEHQEATLGRTVIHDSEHFSAIAKAPYGSSTLNASEALVWNNVVHEDGAGLLEHQAAVLGDQGHIARLLPDGRHILPLSTSGHGGIVVDRSTRMLENTPSYVYDLEHDDMYSEGEREMVDVEVEVLSQEYHAAMGNGRRPRPGSIEEPIDVQIDGRRSCDTDLQKRKGSSLKMVRRLTTRSRIRSLPSSDPNSPDNKGSLLRVPRFAMSRHNRSHNGKKGQLSVDPVEASEQAGELLEGSGNAMASLKKSKLKGAAGSLARFFQGKLAKQAVDSSR